LHEGLVFGSRHGEHVLRDHRLPRPSLGRRRYILAILVGYLRGRVSESQIELLGLYWCFVDFVWVFVFSFVYPSLAERCMTDPEIRRATERSVRAPRQASGRAPDAQAAVIARASSASASAGAHRSPAHHGADRELQDRVS